MYRQNMPMSTYAPLTAIALAACGLVTLDAAEISGKVTLKGTPPPEKKIEFDATFALWLGALELRYHLVKLRRVPAFFECLHPLSPGDEVELVAQLPRDADYVDLVQQIAADLAEGLAVLSRCAAGSAAWPA